MNCHPCRRTEKHGGTRFEKCHLCRRTRVTDAPERNCYRCSRLHTLDCALRDEGRFERARMRTRRWACAHVTRTIPRRDFVRVRHEVARCARGRVKGNRHASVDSSSRNRDLPTTNETDDLDDSEPGGRAGVRGPSSRAARHRPPPTEPLRPARVLGWVDRASTVRAWVASSRS